MDAATAHISFLSNAILKAEAELFVRMQPHYHLVEHIATLSGITELSAAIIPSEIGFDMNVFESAKHLTSWAGLTPANNESAGKNKSVRIGRPVPQAAARSMRACSGEGQERNLLCHQVPAYQEAPRPQESNHSDCQDDAHLHLPYSQTGECFNPSALRHILGLP
jgi:hypothetical protein